LSSFFGRLAKMEANGGNLTSSDTASFINFTHFSHNFRVKNNADSRTKHFPIKSQTAITANSRFSIGNDLEGFQTDGKQEREKSRKFSSKINYLSLMFSILFSTIGAIHFCVNPFLINRDGKNVKLRWILRLFGDEKCGNMVDIQRRIERQFKFKTFDQSQFDHWES
jgi:hypothetical protein